MYYEVRHRLIYLSSPTGRLLGLAALKLLHRCISRWSSPGRGASLAKRLVGDVVVVYLRRYLSVWLGSNFDYKLMYFVYICYDIVSFEFVFILFRFVFSLLL